MPLTATIQNRKKPSAPSWPNGLRRGPNTRSAPRSTYSKPVLRSERTPPVRSACRFDRPSSVAAVEPGAGNDDRRRAERNDAGEEAHCDGVADAVTSLAGIVDRAQEADAVDEPTDAH